LSEFVEARLILETELAGLCAERITQEDLDEMGVLVKQMKSTVHNPDEFWKHDLSFHLATGSAAKNEILNNVLTKMREQMIELIGKSLMSEESTEQALRQHTRILNAFRQHNPTKAREAMRYHLQSFQRGYAVLHKCS
jgi:GntR family transcriptional repressor for pyruvate dehydrogenase complex